MLGQPTARDGRSVWAIGDIHGQADLLDTLLAALPRKAGDVTVFLGDYVDRGPHSRRVVERVLQLQDEEPENTILLWGNHEAAAAGYFRLPNPLNWCRPDQASPATSFLLTLNSFGISPPFEPELACPTPLLELFGRLRTFWRCSVPGLQHVIFVHAGVPSGQRPEESTPDDLLEIREEFTKVTDHSGRLVVFGHTSSRTVLQRPDKIGIDTGAGYGGPLSALELPALRLFKAYPEGRVTSLPLLTPDRWQK